MKKIILNVLAIALTVGVVSGTAYALFTDTVDIAGITITSGNADLKVALNNETVSGASYTEFRDNVSAPWDLKNTAEKYWLKNFYPGMEDWGHFRLRNDSKSEISLVLKGTITSATTWNLDLANSIQLMITNDDGTVVETWHTLENWNQNTYTFDGVLAPNETKIYRVYVKLPISATDSVANMKLEDINFEITGTQVTP
jgi:hypothetical protein